MNVWAFTGNLGRDAEQRFTANENSVVNFSVAVKSGYGDRESTTWVKCSMWGKRGESVLPYLIKGAQVAIHGEVSLREYEKKDKSGTGFSLEVRVNDLTLIGGKLGANKPEKEEAPVQTGFRNPEPTPSDDGFGEDPIPF